MIRKDVTITSGLRSLGLSEDEATIYLTLLRVPDSPLGLSKQTGLKRTRIYSLLDSLEKRSLITRQLDERGTYFTAADPTNLGVQLSEYEARLKEQQQIFGQIVPMLDALRGSSQGHPFSVHVYEGAEGFKRMMWHELKTKGEQLSLGGGDVEELVPNPAWAKRHRERVVEAGYRVREIINSEIDLPTFIPNEEYLRHYTCRGIPVHLIPLQNQVVIYNDTVAIYNWRQDRKMGTEIVNKAFADTMRGIFEFFWKLTEPTTTRTS